MKKILLSIIALCCTVVAGAQGSSTSQQLSAVLQKGETTTVFYGPDALVNAYNAAENGSVITLTSGLFNSPNDIKKAVKIFGAGFEDGIREGTKRTNINGGINLYAEAEGSTLENLWIEGVYVNGNIGIMRVAGLTIAKCMFGGLVVNGAGVESVLVRQCCLTGSVNGGNYLINGLTVKNSYISRINASLIVSDDNRVLFDHCILGADEWHQNHAAATYTNSIICNSYANDGIASGAYSEKNIYARGGIHEGVVSINDWFGVNFSTLFSDGVADAGYAAERTFELAAPDTYKGTDGTPVGVTGGDYPWYKVPSIPYVKNLNATVNGTSLDVNYDAGVGSTNPPTE